MSAGAKPSGGTQGDGIHVAESANRDLAALAEAAAREAAASTVAVATAPLLVFRTADRWFAVHAEDIAEVILKGEVTSVPLGAKHVLGATLVRSRLVPVIALEELLGLSSVGDAVATLPRLLVLKSSDIEVAVVADEIRGIIDLSLEGALGQTHAGNRPAFVLGEIMWQERLLCLIDAPGLIADAMGEAGHR